MNRRQVLQGIGALAAAGLARAEAAPPAPARAPAAARRSIQINAATLNYSIAGEDNEHPLIVLHGGRGQGQHEGVFAANRALADRYRVIGFDMRGHGHSSLTPPYTFDQIVEDIEQLRQTLGGNRKMVLSGGSFGGFIALSYAVKYPQHLTHLILRGTAPSYRHEEEAIGNFQARAASKAPAATRAMLDKVFTPTITDDEEFRLIMFALAPMYLPEGATADYDRILESSRKGIYHAKVHNDLYLPEVWRRYDVVDRLKDIPVPTLVICGESDWICDPAQSRLMASKIPRSRLVVVPGADHAVPPEVLLRETRAFLAES
ncbi:alpha/beta hydrolase [Xanthomonas sp. AmX2]|uniref:alpha/beta fold hydrolase n=1 Tax=Xanthomonas sp. TaxID=29446 RepID=UPI00197D4C8F|nr:alpha/beta hydrolase [Xanthomonas sp.]MBN6151877.1 alpha/beta hydrolase [Xanthomonas sp.]